MQLLQATTLTAHLRCRSFYLDSRLNLVDRFRFSKPSPVPHLIGLDSHLPYAHLSFSVLELTSIPASELWFSLFLRRS
jgi:hypothetical protein